MIAISYGGGTNSTALVIEALHRGIRPDLIVFSDTGAEMPHTYQFLEEFSKWLSSRYDIKIHRVRWLRIRGERAGRFLSIDAECLEDGDLPSRAYGLSGCTFKYKQQPIDNFVKSHPLAYDTFAKGERVERWLGYGAEEDRGAGILESNQLSFFPKKSPWLWRAPLQEWNIDREECAANDGRAGLSQPGKSSCYMCPSMQPDEIRALAKNHPDLMAKALEIEDRAKPNLRNVKGLGRDFSWRDLLEGKPVDACRVRASCGCHDGDLFA